MIKIRLHDTRITNTHLTTWNTDEWFPVWRDGKLDNKEEFVEYKMNQYRLRSRGPILRALAAVGVE